MLYVIKDGVRELDQWCNKLLHYSEAVKQDDTPKVQWNLFWDFLALFSYNLVC